VIKVAVKISPDVRYTPWTGSGIDHHSVPVCRFEDDPIEDRQLLFREPGKSLL
jgi:hypothetical protein